MSNPRYTTKVLRDAFFALPDSRGNIPHLTYEDAEHEARRLNAPRYETVGQMDEALDQRIRAINAPSRLNGATAPPLPGAQQGVPGAPGVPQQGGSIIGSLLLVALGVGVAYLMFKGKDGDGDDGDEKDVTPRAPLQNHAPNPAPVVTVVMPNPAAPALPAPALPAPAPAPVLVPTAIENPSPKRRRRTKVITTTQSNTVVATESKQT